MTVNNAAVNVPQQILDIFYGYLPYGSDYVAYCEYNNAQSSRYVLLYRKIGEKTVSSVFVNHSAGGDYLISESSTNTEYDGFSVSSPYYAYSNLKGQGRYTALPSGQNLVVLMCVICASLMVLKTVFGGIRWFRRKTRVY